MSMRAGIADMRSKGVLPARLGDLVALRQFAVTSGLQPLGSA